MHIHRLHPTILYSYSEHIYNDFSTALMNFIIYSCHEEGFFVVEDVFLFRWTLLSDRKCRTGISLSKYHNGKK